MKKALYLHGLDSNPNRDKTEFLEKELGLTVYAPKLNYYGSVGSTKLFELLSGLVDYEDVDLIIGSSFGGYMGFYLSECYDIPSYLFNPALHSRTIEVPIKIVRNNSRKTLFLGKKDTVIDPEKTIAFLRNHNYDNCITEILPTGHQIPVKVFADALRDFLKL